MLNDKQDPDSSHSKKIAEVKKQIVLEIRKENVLNFGIEILVIIIFVAAIFGFIIIR